MRNGSVPRKLKRPTFSPPITLSNRNEGADALDPAERRDGSQPISGQLPVDGHTGRCRVQAAGEFFVRGAITTHRAAHFPQDSRGNHNACTLTAGPNRDKSGCMGRTEGALTLRPRRKSHGWFALRAAPPGRCRMAEPHGCLTPPEGELEYDKITLHRETVATLLTASPVVRLPEVR